MGGGWQQREQGDGGQEVLHFRSYGSFSRTARVISSASSFFCASGRPAYIFTITCGTASVLSDIAFHADLRSETIDAVDEPGLNGGDQRRVRVQHEVGGNLTLEPEFRAIGRQD